jgi:hypothetical protein
MVSEIALWRIRKNTVLWVTDTGSSDGSGESINEPVMKF